MLFRFFNRRERKPALDKLVSYTYFKITRGCYVRLHVISYVLEVMIREVILKLVTISYY